MQPDLLRDLLSPPGLIDRAIVAATERLFYSSVLHRVRFVVGSANIPSGGPYILVANHQSYLDNFLTAGLVWILQRRRVWIPTKVKAFHGWFRDRWHRACGSVPIDQSDPDGAYRTIAALLARGEPVLMFPEGQRSDGSAMLPFRYGAFNLAAELDVPIVPVGLRDTGRVLPKGRLRFVKGETAAVAFGAPIVPRELRAKHGDDPRALARALAEETRHAIQALAYGNERTLCAPDAIDAELTALAGHAERELERLLDRGADTIRRSDARRVLRITGLARLFGRSNGPLDVQHVRAYGFWVRALPRLVAAARVARLKALLEAAWRAQPTHPYLNYSLGQFHQQVPAFLGGSAQSALAAMCCAYYRADAHGIDRERFAIGYATALAAVGRSDQAMQVLRQHFERAEPAPTPRLARRRERATALLERLRTDTETPANQASHA